MRVASRRSLPRSLSTPTSPTNVPAGYPSRASNGVAEALPGTGKTGRRRRHRQSSIGPGARTDAAGGSSREGGPTQGRPFGRSSRIVSLALASVVMEPSRRAVTRAVVRVCRLGESHPCSPWRSSSQAPLCRCWRRTPNRSTWTVGSSRAGTSVPDTPTRTSTAGFAPMPAGRVSRPAGTCWPS